MFRLICLLLVLVSAFARPVLAETFITFEKCADSKGRAVAVIADGAIKEVVRSGIEEDGMVIRYNAKVLPQLLPESRQFIFAHECARHFLGAPVVGERTLEQARRADCEAHNVLVRSKLIARAEDLAPVVDDLKMVSTEDWSLLPGPQRELSFAACAPSAQTRGNLALPAAPAHSDKWNACVQACGARLFACGRSTQCQTVYDQCNRACGD